MFIWMYKDICYSEAEVIKMYLVRLRELREKNRMVQKTVAAILDTSQEQYSKYERGARDLPIKHLVTLAKFYKVSTDYILGLTNDPNR